MISRPRWRVGLSLARTTRALPLLSLAVLFAVLAPRNVVAQSAGVVPAPVTELPRVLTLDEAIRLLHTRGLDLLIADASVRGAEGSLRQAQFIYNPSIAPSVGAAFNYSAESTAATPCIGCSDVGWGVGVSDSAAIEDVLSGKRELRIRAARLALAAARLGRDDAERNLVFQLRALYVQLVAARWTLDFARETQTAMRQTVELNRHRYPGVINEGDLARIEVQGLEAEQAVDAALGAFRSAQVSVAYLLGVRGASIPDFDVDHDALGFRVPAGLENPNVSGLIRQAVEHRPDVRQADYLQRSAVAQVNLARRQVFPDIALQLGYTQFGTGQNAIQPPTFTVGISTTLPLFYQQQGEIRIAEANRDTQALNHEVQIAQATGDVESALASFNAARSLVVRMEHGGLLDQSRRAVEITRLQYAGGSATLMDLLDAQRTFISTNLEHITDLATYWTAIYQLEQAVGTDFAR